jgi:plasmid stabilization system protein ParE
MARGSKSSYSGKQKRKAEKIAKSYKKRGVSAEEAKSRAWATTNKESGGGKKSGSGRGKKASKAASRKGGKKAAKRAAGRKGAKKAAARRK